MPENLESAFASIISGHAEALFTIGNLQLFDIARMVDFAAKSRLPAIYQFRNYVDSGGLMSYSANIAVLSRRAATYVDKILKGAEPADLPVELPTIFEFVINLKTAKALGLTISRSVLEQATEVIE